MVSINTKFGLIKGRHDMNVKDYIIINKIPKVLLKEENIYILKSRIMNEIKEFQKRNDLKSKKINLYLTGLSRVQHIVISYLIKLGYNVKVWDYTLTEDKYLYITSYKK